MALLRRPPGQSIRVVLASGLLLGLMPVAPGSFGALPGVGIHIAAYLLLPAAWLRPTLVIAFILLTVLHVYLTPWAIEYWQDEDPKHFVLDEVLGYLVVPILLAGQLPATYLATGGFVLFRVFDIVKVPPAAQIDRHMHGAAGILLDDVVSGVYAAATLYAITALTGQPALR